MKRGKRTSILRNQKGILTLDFIFSIVMMFAFATILFGFSMTFTAVEVAQYATYASARAYFAAAKNSDQQEKAGQAKFAALVEDKNSVLSNFFRNGWFELGKVEIKDYSDEFSSDPNKDSDTFQGARVSFIAKILHRRFPLLGSTASDDLSANISSYLSREPTEEECTIFVGQRFQQIQQLKPGFAASYVQPMAYAKIMDDGC